MVSLKGSLSDFFYFHLVNLFLFCMYVHCKPRTTWPPCLGVSMLDYRTDGLGSISQWAHISQCFFTVFILNYFRLVIWDYKKGKMFTLYFLH